MFEGFAGVHLSVVSESPSSIPNVKCAGLFCLLYVLVLRKRQRQNQKDTAALAAAHPAETVSMQKSRSAYLSEVIYRVHTGCMCCMM